MTIKNLQYKFLRTLEQLTSPDGSTVKIVTIQQAWPEFPGYDAVLNRVPRHYFQCNLTNYQCESYTLLPDGYEWLRQERNNRITKWAAIISALLAALGIVISILF